MNAKYWIEKLNLSPHPEGGYYRQTYKSTEKTENGKRFSTAIYYLLEGDDYSAFHRIKSDELWHFYEGGSLTIFVIDKNGELIEIKLGKNFEAGDVFQAIVKAGCWFAAKVNAPASYSLVGCTVSPGFEFEDFEIAKRFDLISLYPKHQEIIGKLTK